MIPAFQPNQFVYDTVLPSAAESVPGLNPQTDKASFGSALIGIKGTEAVEEADKTKPAEECQTCKNRKYQDGSDEMVSFKTAQHISPQSAASRVRAHEMEHVSNAYAKAEQENGKVLRASVSLKTAICPECGRAYVCGGVTNTQIKYSNEENPYQKNLKEMQKEAMSGFGFDSAV